MPALVVRAAVADRARTRAEGRHWDDDRENEIAFSVLEGGIEAHLVVQEPLGARDGRRLLDEEGEFDGCVGAGTSQSARQFDEHPPDAVHMKQGSVGMERLEEAAHVRPLEMVRQIHRELDCRDRLAGSSLAPAHAHRIAEVLHPHPINRQFARVRLILDVGQLAQVRITGVAGIPCCRDHRPGGRHRGNPHGPDGVGAPPGRAPR